MSRPPDILRLIDRLARERTLTDAEMADFIGVHPSSFVHARAGRQPLTAHLLARIVRAFPERDAEMKELVYRYLMTELSLSGGLHLPSSDEPLPHLPIRVIERIRRYVRQFPRLYLDGRSLCVTGDDSRELSAAASFAASLVTAARVPFLRRDAHTIVRASEQALLVRTRLLIVDRVEFACASLSVTLGSRLDMDRPVIVTSARDLASALPPDLASRLAPRCTIVTLAPPAEPDA